MHKKLSFLITAALVFLLTACAAESGGGSSPAESTLGQETNAAIQQAGEGQEDGGEQPGEKQGRILIAWFSRVGNTEFPEDVDAVSSASLNLLDGELTGNTELIADMIRRETGGEMFRIETEKSYPADYEELVDYGRSEPKEDSRPVLSSHVENMDGYDIIFLGFPNWWFDMPMPVYSFLEEYDFSGKTLVPFCTHGGSRFSDIISTLEEMLPETMVTDGFEVYGENASDAGNDVLDWLKEVDGTVSVLDR